MLSLSRYRWSTVEVGVPAQLADIRSDYSAPVRAEYNAAMAHKALFHQTRVYLRLEVSEVAKVFGASIEEVLAVETGERRFCAPMDLKAALDQLWLTAQEKYGYAALSR